MMFFSVEGTTLLHYCTIGTTVILPSLGVALGQARVSKTLMKAIDQQPAARANLNKIFVIGLALTETAAILSTLVGSMLLATTTPHHSASLAQLGASIAITIPAFFAGYLSALPIIQTLLSLARQPFLTQPFLNILLLSLAIMQTPVLFGLIVSWIIQQQLAAVTTAIEGIKLLAAGLALGLGSVGPLIGLSLFSQQACRSMGTNAQAYSSILSFTFLSQALIETPILFSLVVALLLCFSAPVLYAPFIAQISYLMAALVISCSTLAAGISSGYTARSACKQIGENPHLYSVLSRTSIIAQTLIDTTPIYGLVIALLIIFSLG